MLLHNPVVAHDTLLASARVVTIILLLLLCTVTEVSLTLMFKLCQVQTL